MENARRNCRSEVVYPLDRPSRFPYGMHPMNIYQTEQLESITAVRRLLRILDPNERSRLRERIEDYLFFRDRVDAFLSDHFSETCTRNCYQNRVSACCSKDGIITFFADVVINLLDAEPEEIDRLVEVLKRENTGFKCVYLSEKGCLWRVKPIVCEMFLCDPARKAVFGGNPGLERTWNELETQKKRFTWPDRPVLFDDLEQYFIDRECRSALMYLHNSPGLLRVKKIASEKGIIDHAR